jgi:hypothetical protein
MEAGKPAGKKINWRRWNNLLHRDLGYLCVGLTVIYAISRIAVNHMHHWNPNYKFERIEETIEPIPLSDRETMVAQAVQRLNLEALPNESFRPDPGTLQMFYDGWSVQVDVAAGIALVERPRDRVILRDSNFLHLNHPKGVWTYVADVYAFLLLFLAISGMFVLKGKAGLTGRGKWFILAGVLVPLGFIALRYLQA